MNLKEMREKLNALGKELSTLGQKTDRTTDEDTRLDAVLAEFNDLAPKVEQALTVANATERAAKLHESTGRLSGIVPGEELDDKGAGGRQVDRRSPGERFAKSQAVLDWLERGGKSSDRVSLNSMTEKEAALYEGAGPVDRYALVTTGSPTYLVPPMIVPGIQRPRDYALTARDVLINGRTTSDTIYFLRELLNTSAATEVAQATATAGSSGSKPEASLTFEQDSAPVVTIAHWIPITRQAIADAAQLQTYIENRLLVGLERRFNSQVWNGAGGGTNMTGIVNTSGVQVLDDAAFAASPVTNSGTDNENFERVLRAATEIELTGDAMMTFAAMNPRDLEKFRTITDQMGRYVGGTPFESGRIVNLWGYNIVADRAITQGTVIAGDGTMAAIWDREDANILIDTINDQFIRNMLTILAEMRAALTVFRPYGFALVTLAAW